MEVTATKARQILGISPGELKRRMERGELKWRKKTASKFSDFLITIPDDNTATVEKKVKEAMKTPKPAPEPEPEEPIAEAPAEEAEPEPAPKKSLRELIRERREQRRKETPRDEKEEEPARPAGPAEPASRGSSDGGAKKSGDASKWWF